MIWDVAFSQPDAELRLGWVRVLLGVAIFALAQAPSYRHFYRDHESALYRRGWLPPLGRAQGPLRWAVSALAVLQALGLGLPWVPLALLAAFALLDGYSASLSPRIWNNLYHVHLFQLGAALGSLGGWLAPADQALPLQAFLLTAMQLQVGLVYGLAGLSKLRVGGLRWFTAPRTLLAAVLFRGTPLGRWAFGTPGRRAAAAALTGAFELAAPVLLLLPAAHPWFAASALAFHLGVALCMRISFWHLWLFFPPLFLQPWPL